MMIAFKDTLIIFLSQIANIDSIAGCPSEKTIMELTGQKRRGLPGKNVGIWTLRAICAILFCNYSGCPGSPFKVHG